jgi:hypothetical protein
MGRCNSEESGKQESRTGPSAAFRVDVRVVKVEHESLCTRHRDRCPALIDPAHAAIGHKKAGDAAGFL